MEYIISQEDIQLLSQPEKTIYLKLELLNQNNRVINSLEGNLISDDFTNDADSDVRRTYNCSFYVDDDSWRIGQDKNIWIDRRICPYVGYESVNSKEIKWYKRGTFLLNAPSLKYSETEHSLSLSCLDLMCTLNGTLGGYIGGDGIAVLKRKIPVGMNIREAVIQILNEAGVKKYNICAFNRTIPYDIEVDVGSTYYNFLEQVINLYSGYEFFFDIDGVFTVQLTPQLQTEPVVLNSEIINPLIINEAHTYDWSAVRNYIEVYGQNIEPQFYSTEVAGTINHWVATIDQVTSYENGDTYAIKVPTTNGATVTININNLGAKDVYNDDEQRLDANKLTPNKIYCFRYRKNSDTMIYLGQYQAYGVYEETSLDCPFSVTNLGYRISGVVTDDAIYSDSLCEQRAKYEVYKASWMQDSITLELMDIPFLSVNQKISYWPTDKNEAVEYITKRISSNSANGTMSMTLVKFSEDYPDMETVYANMYENTEEV